jgi:hypothetical protein
MLPGLAMLLVASLLTLCPQPLLVEQHASAVPVVNSNRMHRHVQHTSYQFATSSCSALHASSQPANWLVIC